MSEMRQMPGPWNGRNAGRRKEFSGKIPVAAGKIVRLFSDNKLNGTVIRAARGKALVVVGIPQCLGIDHPSESLGPALDIGLDEVARGLFGNIFRESTIDLLPRRKPREIHPKGRHDSAVSSCRSARRNVDDDKTAHAIGILQRIGHRDEPAHGVTEQDRGLRSGRVGTMSIAPLAEVGDHVDETVRGSVGGFPMIAKIKREGMRMSSEGFSDGGPVARGAEEAVKNDERSSRAAEIGGVEIH